MSLEKLEKGNHGGARENSGRKPSIEKIKAEAYKIGEAKFWVDLAENKAILALEQSLVSEDEGVKLRAAQEILNRALGKPKETHLLGNQDGKPFEVNSVDKTRAQAIATEYEEKMREAILNQSE